MQDRITGPLLKKGKAGKKKTEFEDENKEK